MQIFSQVIQQLKLTGAALVVAGSAMALTDTLAAEPIQEACVEAVWIKWGYLALAHSQSGRGLI